jgi:hypothetical protein
MLPSHLRTKQWKQEMQLLSSSPLLQTLDDTAIVATVVGETTTSEAGQRITQNPASHIPNRQTSIELPRIATRQSRRQRFTR